MKIDCNVNNFRKKLYFFLILVLFSSLLAFSTNIFQRSYISKEVKEVALSNAKKKIIEKENEMKHFLFESKEILHSIRNIKQFNDFLNNETNKQNVEDIFLAFSKANENFMQLRYIDKNGNEIIRVDREKFGGKSYLVNKKFLQNKLDRYYFKDQLQHTLEKVYFSELDLNIENGKLEIPFNPTLRAILPINHNNKFSGIIIINYFMSNFLSQISNMNYYDTILLNEKGNILKHYNSKYDWSFYKENTSNVSNFYFKLFKKIISENYLETNEFISKKFDIDLKNKIIMIIKPKDEYIIKLKENPIENYNIFALIILLFSIILGIIIFRIFDKNLLCINTLEIKNQELTNNQIESDKLLKSSEDRWKFAVEESGDGLWDWNLLTNEIYFSKRWKEMLGFKDNEITNDLKEWKKRIHPDHVEKCFDDINKYLNGEIKSYKDEHQILCKNGTYKWIIDRGIIVDRDINGNPLRIIGTHTDIDNVKQLSEKLEKSNKDLQNFAYVASHDLQEPLRVISGHLQLIESKYRDLLDEKGIKFLNFAIDGSFRLQRLIQALLEFSRIDRKERNFKLESLNTILTESLENLAKTIQDKNAEIHYTELPQLKCDKYQILQVFQNIISNSLKFSQEDSKPILNINFKKNKNKIIISFEDNGIGFNMKYKDKVFEIFQRLNSRSKYHGEGIGMAISKRIMERHYGEININSEEGKGTTVYLIFNI